jgi:hypothetical protein
LVEAAVEEGESKGESLSFLFDRADAFIDGNNKKLTPAKMSHHGAEKDETSQQDRKPG